MQILMYEYALIFNCNDIGTLFILVIKFLVVLFLKFPVSSPTFHVNIVHIGDVRANIFIIFLMLML